MFSFFPSFCPILKGQDLVVIGQASGAPERGRRVGQRRKAGADTHQAGSAQQIKNGVLCLQAPPEVLSNAEWSQFACLRLCMVSPAKSICLSFYVHFAISRSAAVVVLVLAGFLVLTVSSYTDTLFRSTRKESYFLLWFSFCIKKQKTIQTCSRAGVG